MRKPKRPKYLKKVTISIKDKDWDFFLYTDTSYKSMGEDYEDSDALTSFDNKKVEFNKSLFSLETIRHELFHVLVHSCNTTSSALTTNQMEELACTIVQNDIYLILSLTEKVFSSLREDV
jgi:Zn-dependent peptidase ImmA (M78 family)